MFDKLQAIIQTGNGKSGGFRSPYVNRNRIGIRYKLWKQKFQL